MSNELSEIVSRRIQRLQEVVASAPCAGELSEIRIFLDRLEKSTRNFRDLLDDLEFWKGPNALNKDLDS